MNSRFDELAKAMAQSVTRRAALKRFGVGLAGMVLAFFGLANRAEAKGGKKTCGPCITMCLQKGWGGSYAACYSLCTQWGLCP